MQHRSNRHAILRYCIIINSLHRSSYAKGLPASGNFRAEGSVVVTTGRFKPASAMTKGRCAQPGSATLTTKSRAPPSRRSREPSAPTSREAGCANRQHPRSQRKERDRRRWMRGFSALRAGGFSAIQQKGRSAAALVMLRYFDRSSGGLRREHLLQFTR